jgi:sec-independent protein translocase protein TatA
MGGLSIWHWIIVLVVVLLLFGRNKISDLMGDMAKGIKAFKRGMSEDEAAQADPAKIDPKTIDQKPPSVSAARADAEQKGRLAP